VSAVVTAMPPVATHHATSRAAIQSLPEPKHEGTATWGWSRRASAMSGLDRPRPLVEDVGDEADVARGDGGGGEQGCDDAGEDGALLHFDSLIFRCLASSAR
jgi:hypothetical protein